MIISFNSKVLQIQSKWKSTTFSSTMTPYIAYTNLLMILMILQDYLCMYGGAFSQHVVTISILTSLQASISFADFLVGQLQRDEEVELLGPDLGPDHVVVECQNGSSTLCGRFRIQHCATPHTCWKFVTFIIFFFPLWGENSSINNTLKIV